MRAIMGLCLAWVIVICAAPGVADRYVNTSHSSTVLPLSTNPLGYQSGGFEQADRDNGNPIACHRRQNHGCRA